MLFPLVLAAAFPIAALQPGATVRLPAGPVAALVLRGRRFDPPVTVLADGATVQGIVLADVQGLRWRGGTIVSAEGLQPSTTMQGYAVNIRQSRDISIEGATLTSAVRGVVLAQSDGIALRRLMLTGLRSDGINIALSRRVLVEDVTCSDFVPIARIDDAAGKMIKDGDHPDCIQAWSRPSDPPSADITIRRVKARGPMQGIFLGNHVRNGIDDGGFDRVLIEDNDIEVAFPNGIRIDGGRNSIVRNNRVATPPGARFRTSLRITDGMLACGNRIDAGSNPVGAGRCAAADLARTPPRLP
jgi:hypothetical protein